MRGLSYVRTQVTLRLKFFVCITFLRGSSNIQGQVNRGISPANLAAMLLILNKLNSTCPSTNPCDTPLLTSLYYKSCPFILSFCFVSFSQFLIRTHPLSLRLLSLRDFSKILYQKPFGSSSI